MKKEKIKYFKEKLLKAREEQIHLLENREENREESIEFLDNELSSYDNHPADSGTEMYMMEQEGAYKEQIESVIREIDASLEDIKNGNYGICNNCNKKIREERLELIPYVKSCVGCSGDENVLNEDSENKNKKYESLPYDNFALEPNNDKDNVGYDKEDIFKEIMKDNIIPKDPSFSTGDNLGIMDEDDADSSTVEDIEKISNEDYKDSLE